MLTKTFLYEFTLVSYKIIMGDKAMDVMGPKQHNFTNISFIEGIQKEINEKIPQSMTFRQYSLLFCVCVGDMVQRISPSGFSFQHWRCKHSHFTLAWSLLVSEG